MICAKDGKNVAVKYPKINGSLHHRYKGFFLQVLLAVYDESCNITISLSCHEQVCLNRRRFERYFSHHDPMMGEVSLET